MYDLKMIDNACTVKSYTNTIVICECNLCDGNGRRRLSDRRLSDSSGSADVSTSNTVLSTFVQGVLPVSVSNLGNLHRVLFVLFQIMIVLKL